MSVIAIFYPLSLFIPHHDTDASTIADAQEYVWFFRYFRPHGIQSDHGPNLKALEIANLLNSYCVEHRFTTTS